MSMMSKAMSIPHPMASILSSTCLKSSDKDSLIYSLPIITSVDLMIALVTTLLLIFALIPYRVLREADVKFQLSHKLHLEALA